MQGFLLRLKHGSFLKHHEKVRMVAIIRVIIYWGLHRGPRILVEATILRQT